MLSCLLFLSFLAVVLVVVDKEEMLPLLSMPKLEIYVLKMLMPLSMLRQCGCCTEDAVLLVVVLVVLVMPLST